MATIGTIGATGLVGSEFVKLASQLSTVSKITTYTRREPKTKEKVEAVIEADTDKWPDLIKQHKSDVFFSSFGTTRKRAGSAENFTKIDYGTNYAAAKAAREAGVDTFVLVSTTGASAGSRFHYLKVKGQLEDDILALGFPKTVILRPGLLLGEREQSKGGFEDAFKFIGYRIKDTFASKYFLHPINAEDVAKTALYHGLQPVSGDKQVVMLSAQEVIDDSKKLSV